MTKAKKSIFILLLSVLALMFALFLLTVGGISTVRADDETKTVETVTELDNKGETETGYVPNPESEVKGGATVKEEPEGDAEKEQPASKLATEKGISDESKLLPHYHILGTYQGYDVEVKAYSLREHGPNYEYCDMFDYFFEQNVLRWNTGYEPSTCSEHKFAGFDCLECGEIIIFGLSGRHTLDGESEIVEGYEVKHCSECGEDICVDWYKHETVPEGGGTPTESEPTESEPTEAGNNNQFNLGEWVQNASESASEWIKNNAGVSISSGIITAVGVVLILYLVFRRRR